MDAIVAFALKQRFFMMVLLALVLVGGVLSFSRLNIEAYPDPVPPLVDIVTQSHGQSAEEIERYITIPIEVQMAGIPNVQRRAHDLAVRTVGCEGAVHLRLHLRQAEQWVINRLAQLPPLPNSAQPQISPDQPHRRDLPLPGRRTARLSGDGS